MCVCVREREREVLSAQMKFALNATSDMLPHNANLSLWRKSDNLSAACKLCGERQILCHILNNTAKWH